MKRTWVPMLVASTRAMSLRDRLQSCARHLSEPNLAALEERGVAAYIATGRAKHPGEIKRKIGGPLTQVMRRKLKRAGWRSRDIEPGIDVEGKATTHDISRFDLEQGPVAFCAGPDDGWSVGDLIVLALPAVHRAILPVELLDRIPSRRTKQYRCQLIVEDRQRAVLTHARRPALMSAWRGPPRTGPL